MIRTSWQERFWARVNKDGPVQLHTGTPGTPCWLWTGPPDWNGYGRFDVHGHLWRAHRLSFVLAYLMIPDGLNVLHKCDVRLCVRPDHLHAGTHAQNVQDRVARNRTSRHEGEFFPQAKLTPDLVRQMRAQKAANPSLTTRKLAVEYGLARSSISCVLSGKRWKNVGRGE